MNPEIKPAFCVFKALPDHANKDRNFLSKDITYLINYLLKYLLTYLLPPWSRVLLEKLNVSQLVKQKVNQSRYRPGVAQSVPGS